jgi:hypothetical protein
MATVCLYRVVLMRVNFYSFFTFFVSLFSLKEGKAKLVPCRVWIKLNKGSVFVIRCLIFHQKPIQLCFKTIAILKFTGHASHESTIYRFNIIFILQFSKSCIVHLCRHCVHSSICFIKTKYV